MYFWFNKSSINLHQHGRVHRILEEELRHERMNIRKSKKIEII